MEKTFRHRAPFTRTVIRGARGWNREYVCHSGESLITLDGLRNGLELRPRGSVEGRLLRRVPCRGQSLFKESELIAEGGGFLRLHTIFQSLIKNEPILQIQNGILIGRS